MISLYCWLLFYAAGVTWKGLVVIVPNGVFEEAGTIMLVHVRQGNWYYIQQSTKRWLIKTIYQYTWHWRGIGTINVVLDPGGVLKWQFVEKIWQEWNAKMIGNNNTQQYTPRNYRIVWIVLDLILHTIISCGEEGNVELGDDRRGGSNNNTQYSYISWEVDQNKRRKEPNNQM